MGHLGQVRPLPSVKGQGTDDNSKRTTSPPISPDYPHDTFRAPKSVLMTTSIVKPGDGNASKGAKTVNSVPPRCGY